MSFYVASRSLVDENERTCTGFGTVDKNWFLLVGKHICLGRMTLFRMEDWFEVVVVEHEAVEVY